MKKEELQDGKSKPYLHSQPKFNQYWKVYHKRKYKDKPILFYDWFIRHIQPEYPNPIYRNGLLQLEKIY